MAKHATGKDLYKHFAHAGPPSEVAANPPAEAPHKVPSFEEALGKTPAPKPKRSTEPKPD